MSYEKQLYAELKKIVGDRKLSRSSIVLVLLSLMQVAEKYDKMNGVAKKEAILDVLKHFIDDTADDKEAMEMKLLVDLTLPDVIDNFVSLDKSEIRIHLKKKCNPLLSCCRKH